MIAIDSLVGADRPILETIGFLRLGEGLDIIARRFLIALERGNAISLSSMIFCAMALTAQGVNRCDRAPGQSPEGHRMTLVGSVLSGPLPVAAAFRRAGWPGPGGSGLGKNSAARCGT